MKRMIISPAQLKAINEAMATATADSMSDVLPTFNDLKANQPDQNTPIKINVATNVDGPTYSLTGAELQQKGTSSVPTNTSSFEITNESRYSKRQVELGRMLEMRRTGKVYSKKQLNEMFMETQENADRLRDGIKTCKIKDIFSAVEDIFPEEIGGLKNAFYDGADLPEYICNIFSKDNINADKEEEFLERLGI